MSDAEDMTIGAGVAGLGQIDRWVDKACSRPEASSSGPPSASIFRSIERMSFEPT